MPSMRVKARRVQYLLGVIFLLLGGWALLFPGQVEQLVFAPDYYLGTTTTAVLTGCFGAQAVLCALLIFTARFTASTFLVFGLLGSLPFFVFNYYFLFTVPVFTDWMLLDFAGNLGILFCGVYGWWLARQDQTSAERVYDCGHNQP